MVPTEKKEQKIDDNNNINLNTTVQILHIFISPKPPLIQLKVEISKVTDWEIKSVYVNLHRSMQGGFLAAMKRKLEAIQLFIFSKNNVNTVFIWCFVNHNIE